MLSAQLLVSLVHLHKPVNRLPVQPLLGPHMLKHFAKVAHHLNLLPARLVESSQPDNFLELLTAVFSPFPERLRAHDVATDCLRVHRLGH